MTITQFLIVLAITIIILCVLTIKYKIHPVLVLFICALFVALCGGNTLVESISLIKSNFGSTLGGIGTMIIFGSVIACGIQDTGAVTSMINWFIKLFKGKNLELAPALEAFIMSIPVFGDIGIILNAPIASIIAKRKNMSMTQIAPIINLGLTLTHGLVPPTPGILAVSIMLGANLGQVIVIGLICSLVSFFVTYFTLCKYYVKKGEYISPVEEYVQGVEAVGKDADISELMIKEDNCPSALASFTPLLLPAIMIAIGAFGKTAVSEGSVAYTVFNTMSDGTVSLFIGMIVTMLLAVTRIDKVRENAMKVDSNVNEKSTFIDICCNSWIVRALKISIAPLMITAMGGAMGGILRGQSAISEIGTIVAASSFPKIVIPFILAAVLMCICGSMTTASLTAAALMAPMMATLGISPVCCAIAIGAGSMCFWHANNSGFWIFTSLYGFNTKQGYFYFTGINLFGGIIAFITLILVSVIGLA